MGGKIINLLKKKWRYYGHRSLGPIRDYFGEPGDKVEVGPLVYWCLRLMGYRTTRERLAP
jgi:hypothetical protein